MVMLESERILLRPMRLSDEDEIYKNINSKDVLRHMRNINYPYDRSSLRPFLNRSFKEAKSGKGHTFVIVLKETGKLAGAIDIIAVDKLHSSAYIGYWLGKRFWRKGIMSEALKIVLDFAFKKLKLHRIAAKVAEKNIASKALLEKAGFKVEGIARDARYKGGKWHDEYQLGLLKFEWDGKP